MLKFVFVDFFFHSGTCSPTLLLIILHLLWAKGQDDPRYLRQLLMELEF